MKYGFQVNQASDGEQPNRKTKLEVLREYEEHHLKLIREYKEEIKFINALQEDLRRERTRFFAQSLKEVQDVLNPDFSQR